MTMMQKLTEIRDMEIRNQDRIKRQAQMDIKNLSAVTLCRYHDMHDWDGFCNFRFDRPAYKAKYWQNIVDGYFSPWMDAWDE